MTREYVASANTVDEAIALACKELGISQDECSPEILQMPKKGFFGKIKQQAKVRVVVETMDSVREMLGVEEKPAPAARPAERRPVQKETPKPKAAAPRAAAKPVEKSSEKPAPVKAPAPKAAPAENKPAAPKAPAAEAAPAPKTPAAKPQEPVPAEKPEEIHAAPTEEEIAAVAPKIEVAKQYLTDIFSKMGIEGISMTFAQTEGRTVVIHLDGEQIGAVIGKRGETLDAVQYLVCLAANRLKGDYVRFTINAGNYREKREETLKALALRMARKVLKTGRPAALEPMNPYERRIIHAVITDVEGVFSKSTGEEPNRKVVIKPAGRSGAYRSGRGNESRPRRSSYAGRKQETSVPFDAEKPAAEAEIHEPVREEASAPRESKKINDDVKLYSKIEID